MDIGAQIRYWRRTRELTQTELAEKAEISTSTLKRYESGEGQPTFDSLQKLANALEISISDFLLCSDPIEAQRNQKISDIEHKLERINCTVEYDEVNSCFWIDFLDGFLKVSEQEIEELNRCVDSYLTLRLNELRLKHADQFEPKENKQPSDK